MIARFVIKLLIVYTIEIGKNNFFMGIREEEKTLDSLIFIYKSGQLKNTIFTMFMKGLFQYFENMNIKYLIDKCEVNEISINNLNIMI